jgi:hypothetical protein
VRGVSLSETSGRGEESEWAAIYEDRELWKGNTNTDIVYLSGMETRLGHEKQT